MMLTTRGITPDMREQFHALLSEAAAGDTKPGVALVVTAASGAADPEKRERVISESLQLLQQFGARVFIVDAARDTAEHMESSIRVAHCIYVLGGNTFYLWHHMRQSGLDALVRRRVAEGALYVGASAGSIVAGQSISTALWKGWDDPSAAGPAADWSQPHSYRALGLVPESFFPHYEEETWGALVRSRRHELGHSLVTLMEHDGAYVRGLRDGSHNTPDHSAPAAAVPGGSQQEAGAAAAAEAAQATKVTHAVEATHAAASQETATQAEAATQAAEAAQAATQGAATQAAEAAEAATQAATQEAATQAAAAQEAAATHAAAQEAAPTEAEAQAQAATVVQVAQVVPTLPAGVHCQPSPGANRNTVCGAAATVMPSGGSSAATEQQHTRTTAPPPA